MSISIITSPDFVSLCENPVVFQFETNNRYDIDGNIRDFFRIHAIIYRANSYNSGYAPAFTSISSSEVAIEPDTNDRIKYNVSPFLKKYINNDFNRAQNPDVITPNQNAIVIYRVTYWETWGTSNEQSTKKTTQYYYAIGGGLTEFRRKLTNWYDLFRNSKQFLTWAPYKRMISRTEPIKLYYVALNYGVDFISTGAFSNPFYYIRAYVKVYYDDNTTYQTQIEEYTSYSAPNFYELDCGYEALGIANLNPSKNAVAYSFWLSGTQAFQSEKRTFVLNDENIQFPLQMYFRNSLNGFDSIYLKAYKTEDADFSRDYVSRYNNTNYASDNIQNRRALTTNRFMFSIRTTDNEYRKYLTELIQTDEFYIILNDEEHRMNITVETLTHSADIEYLYELIITAEAINFERFYDNIYQDEYTFNQIFNEGISYWIINSDFLVQP